MLPGGGAEVPTEVKPLTVRRQRDTPIETWIDMVDMGRNNLASMTGQANAGDRSRGLPVLMECIAKTEKHPEVLGPYLERS